METWKLYLTIIILVIIIYYLWNKQSQTQHKYKSTVVKHGQAFEQYVPFMKDFPFDKNKCVFIGKPIDLLAFEKEGIYFIEVKTGKSRLSNKQHHIKKLIKNNKVYFKEIKV